MEVLLGGEEKAAGGVQNGSGGTIEVIGVSAINEYIKLSGINGSNNRAGALIACAIGGNSVNNNGKFSCGIGKDFGTGGDQHGIDDEGGIECDHVKKGQAKRRKWKRWMFIYFISRTLLRIKHRCSR